MEGEGDYIYIGTMSGRGYEGGGRGRLIIHCYHQNDYCIKMGSNESPFNISFINCEGQSHKTVSTNHNPFEEKGEPKRYRTEVLLFASLTASSHRLTIL